MSKPFKMKGSPHKLGTIEGTSAHKASIAKAKEAFAVEQTRTSGDKTLVAAASELGSSYIPAGQDYSIDTGFTTKYKEKKEDDGDNGKEEEEEGVLEKEITDTSDLTKEEREQLGQNIYPEEESETEDYKAKKKKEEAKKKKEEARRKSISEFSWSDYLKTGELYE